MSRWNWYKTTTPKSVEGGIKAKSKKGAIASKWWSKKWIAALERFQIGARLNRGRAYARKGQVAELKIEKGMVTARVQGSRSGAYRIKIKLKTHSESVWKSIAEKVVEQPIFAAQLLGNEMPDEIETLFNPVKTPLFPKTHGDLETDCSCPDWSNPCKHIAAVYYLIAEALDSDPFLLFKLRGIEREEFLEMIRKCGGTEEIEEEPEIEPVELPTEEESFFGVVPEETDSNPSPKTPSLHAAIPKRLGSLGFWRGETPFHEKMEEIYHRASLSAVELIEEKEI